MNWRRPWYQSRTVILSAATVPPMAVVALVEFAKGGYLLAYLPGAVIALLLVPGALLRTGSSDNPGRRRRSVGAMAWAGGGDGGGGRHRRVRCRPLPHRRRASSP